MTPKVIPLIGTTGVKLTNTTILENLTDSDIQYHTIKKLYDSFHPDGIFTFMDLTVEAEVLGLKIKHPPNDTPSVLEHSVKTREQLELVMQKYNGVTGRMNIFIETVKKLFNNLETSVGAYCIGPFTLAGELNGVNGLLMNTIIDPEFVHQLVDFSTLVISDYARELFKAGADTVCILEPTAVMLSAEMYDEFSLKAFQKISQNVDYQPLVLHICGDTTHLIEKMTESGANALSLDSVVNFQEIIDQIPAEMDLIGNLDPVSVFLNGSNDHVTEATKCLKHEMRDYPNFVLSTGCDLPLDTPLENVHAFMETARE